MRSATLAIGVLLVAAAGARAQDASAIASRVARAGDGEVRLQYPPRPGVCGDGGDMVSFHDTHLGVDVESHGRWGEARCEFGPVRVALTVRSGKVIQVRTVVGGSWPAAGARLTDLGTVGARDAAAYFFALVPQLEHTDASRRILLPAVVADAGDVTPQLGALMEDRARATETRSSAAFWLGELGGAAATPKLRALIERRDEEPRVREAAVFALSQDESDHGRWLLDRAMDESETPRVRRSALFWAGQHESTPTSALVQTYERLSDEELREHALFVLSQRRDDAAVDALLRIAREEHDRRLRDRALFWLAQKDDPRVTKLISDLLER